MRRALFLLVTCLGATSWPSAQAQRTVVAWGNSISGRTEVPAGLTNASAVAAGFYHSLCLLGDGHVVGWGNNWSGQTNVPPGLVEIIKAVAGPIRNLVLRSDGTVAVWGEVWDGHMQSPATAPADLTDVLDLAAGFGHSVALHSDGRITAWGDNYNGVTNVPTGFLAASAVAAGFRHSLALLVDGTVAAWGENYFGQCNVPAGLRDVIAIAAGDSHCLALRADGTVIGWGDNRYGQATTPPGLQDVIGISAGRSHSLALRNDGTVIAWGENNAGQTDVPVGLLDVQAVAAGDEHNLAIVGGGAPYLSSALPNPKIPVGGRVQFHVSALGQRPLSYQWHRNGLPLTGATEPRLLLTDVQVAQAGAYSVTVSNALGQSTSASALLEVVPLLITSRPSSHVGFIGEHHTFNVIARSTPTASYQWLRNGIALPNATNASLTVSNLGLDMNGQRFSVAVTNAYGGAITPEATLSVGLLAAWGQNHYAQAAVPTAVTEVVAVAAGFQHNLGLRPDGTVFAWGEGRSDAFLPSELTNVIAIAADWYDAALRADGSVLVWGTTDPDSLNVPPAATSGVVALACGGGNTYALRHDHTLVGWGFLYGTIVSPPDRLTVPPLTEVTAIAAGDYFALALKADGTVAAWGAGFWGETNIPTGLNEVISIACGDYHSLALRRDGTVVAWGADWAGTNVPPGLSNVVSIAAGYSHSIALRADGSVVTWRGDYDFGQTRLPSGLGNVVAIASGSYHGLALLGGGASSPENILEIHPRQDAASIVLSGQPRKHYVLESTPDLSNPGWSFRRNLRPTPYTRTFLEADTSPTRARFYRARQVQ